MNRGPQLVVALLLATGILLAQPTRDLRGVWMATVLNIDYPRQPTRDPARLQQEFRAKLQRLRMTGMNAIFVQVRSAGDALYPSQYAPWSQWLTGRQGQAPEGNFDPLTFMIDEAHAQGVELHAWVNPYRVAMSLDSLALHPSHLFYQHRDWVRIYGDRMYLDPGLPEVREHLGKVIDELVDNYDIDGLHFDDYFYPYPISGQDFPDYATYFEYGWGRLSLPDWRRDNVNIFVRETYRRIKEKKPWVHFGISPFGVWRNAGPDAPLGSNTSASVGSYDDLYGDALAWASTGTVDYLLPQLYWSIGYPLADYAELAKWWTTYTPTDVQLYVGHAAYKVRNNADETWSDLNELPRQVAFNQDLGKVEGSVYFSTKSILDNPFGLVNILQRTYPDLALLPPRRQPAAPPPVALKAKKRKSKEESGVLLVWEVDKATPDNQLPHYYAIYRDRELIHRTPYGQNCRQYHYKDRGADKKSDYAVVPMDRYHHPLTGRQSQFARR